MFVALLIFGLLWTAECQIDTKNMRGVQIKNVGHERLWMQMTGEDSFVLPPGQLTSVILDSTWSGSISARSEYCQYMKCNSPMTRAEFSFGGETEEDRYHIYIVEGFNRPMKIQPTGANNFCRPAFCNANINEQCPPSHQVKNEDDVIACRPLPDLFRRLCPRAIATAEDYKTNDIGCKTSDTYFVSIG